MKLTFNDPSNGLRVSAWNGKIYNYEYMKYKIWTTIWKTHYNIDSSTITINLYITRVGIYILAHIY